MFIRFSLTNIARTTYGARMTIDWRTDVEAAAAEAREAGRPLFVDFAAPG